MTELDRTKVTFEQAEGLESLPTQLKPRELTPRLRNSFWFFLYRRLNEATGSFNWALQGPWRTLLHDYHAWRQDLPTDEFDPRSKQQAAWLKKLILHGSYGQVFGFLEFVLRHPACPHGLGKDVEMALKANRAGYRLVDGKTFFPIASEEDAKVTKQAFADLDADIYAGAHKHLTTAAERLTAGDWPGGIRESMQAVESVVRILTGEAAFSKAIAVLEQRWSIHRALKASFGNLYGYTSDEPGIRHPLLDDPKAAVDEADALFMFGACSSFLSYLISKAKNAETLGRPLGGNDGG